ncbi:acyltransferase family protein [Pseudoalteromonas sp. T1lg23B]|uniref:acyltransferase family protein n=1 Tax=Pseudoalteromonas sp. T1lg23B TaxID=2077097 RepID=UPI000CF74930|nr:acyltransferase family protein [Pseudoalteromonas sp. T1lg23B]
MDKARYSELDWLRVMLILAVFLHHVFMPFNGDGWHVMNRESSKLLDDIMVYFEQLRLQTLFFIAGAGSYLLLQRTTTSTFLMSKFHRLLVPLLIGMMFIVPPQSYFEHIDEYASMLEAYQDLLLAFEANHLWFIEFLIVFMILAVPVFKLLKRSSLDFVIAKIERISDNPHGLFLLVGVLVVLRLTAKFFMPSQSHSIDNLSVSLFFLFFFITGMMFIKSPKIWMALAQQRKTNLIWFIASSVLFYGYYFKPDISAYVSLEMRWQLWWLVCTLVSWSGLLVFMGYAITYCKTTPKWLKAANQLIYPFYVLHQTVIVILAFYIVQWQASIAIKSLSLLLSSLFICILLCVYVIKPFDVCRYIFGLKVKPVSNDSPAKTAQKT